MKWGWLALCSWAGCSTALAIASFSIIVTDAVWIPVVSLLVGMLGMLGLVWLRLGKVFHAIEPTFFEPTDADMDDSEQLLTLIANHPISDICTAIALQSIRDRDTALFFTLLKSHLHDHGNEETAFWLGNSIRPRLLDSEYYWLQEELRPR
jgi:hypothetical protein